LAVTAVAGSVQEARALAYAAAEPIEWDGMVLRHDIAAAVGALGTRQEVAS
jgi:phosphoribosylamine-glycine ligase